MESDEVKRGIDIAVAFIAFRSRSEQEVRRRLRRAGLSSDSEEVVVSRLKVMSLVDDRTFAGAYARDQMLGRKRGPLRVRQGLRSLGVEDSVAESVIAQIEDDLDVVEQARALGRKRWHRVAETSSPLATKKKVYDYLVRCGYPGETARSVVDQLERAHDRT